MKPDLAADLIVTLALGVVIGGRLGYVFFYQQSLLWTFSNHIPWWGVLAINDGGMASHGGMIGGLIAAFWFARRHGLDWAFVFDLLAFGAAAGFVLRANCELREWRVDRCKCRNGCLGQ